MIHDLTQQKRIREHFDEMSTRANKLLGQWQEELDLETLRSIYIDLWEFSQQPKETSCN